MALGDNPIERESLTQDGCYRVASDGRRFLDLAGSEEGDDFASGQRFVEVFAAECAAQDVRGALRGGPARYAIEFAGQEDASPELMGRAFRAEMEAAGALVTTELVWPAGMTADDLAHAEGILRHCVRRIRTLLVEHNSYLSGGLRYPFAATLPGVAERGLAIYRFPKHGPVTVSAREDRVRIEFDPGEVGAITSSGCFVPTLIQGDFTLEAEYEILRWAPDDVEPICFAVYAQNQDSTHRYYGQRMSVGSDHHELTFSHVDQLSPIQPVEGPQGAFRVQRDGEVMRGFHRSPGGDWTALGTAEAPPQTDMVLGAKIWTKLRSGGICVEIYNLRIDGRMAAEQIPPVPVVQDPRSIPPTRP